MPCYDFFEGGSSSGFTAARCENALVRTEGDACYFFDPLDRNKCYFQHPILIERAIKIHNQMTCRCLISTLALTIK